MQGGALSWREGSISPVQYFGNQIHWFLAFFFLFFSLPHRKLVTRTQGVIPSSLVGAVEVDTLEAK